jgi:outer membrane receptor protein involved in Fe transport
MAATGKVRRFGLLVSTVLASSFIATAGWPQATSVQPQPAKPAPTPAASGKIEEIVVTAQHRSEKLSKVPISITVLSKDQMDKQGVRSINDIARLVPGLNLQSSNELGDTNISIRGIVSNTGAETTGVYIDDTPVQARQEIVASNPYPKVFDLQDVEVLRGPQGTLFGAGSEGGTIRFITPDPSLSNYSGYFRSEVADTLGGSPSYELGAAVGGPIIEDKLGFRVSLWDRYDGGYINRIDPVTDNQTATDANHANSTVFRAALKAAPTEDLTIEPAVFFQDVKQSDRDFYWEAVGPFNELSQIPQPHTDKYILPSLNVSYDFGDFTLKSISSFFHRDVNDTFDATAFELSGLLPGGAIALPGYPDYLSVGTYADTQVNYTQELRVTSNDSPGDRFSWVGGIYYQHNVSSDHSAFNEPFNDVSDYLSILYGYGPGNSLSYFGEAPVDGKYSYLDTIDVTETDLAAYGNLTYNITPTIKASAGVRVARSGFSYTDLQDGPYGPGAPTAYSGSESETPVTPRFNLIDQLTPEQMVYATVAKGYRIGGANESLEGIVSCVGDLAQLHIKNDPPTYQSDSTWSYEAGAKGRYFGGSLVVDASIFWIDWSGIQQEVYLPDCGYYYTANLGEAVSRGFDVQADWKLGYGFELSGNAGLTDARYTKTLLLNGNILAQSGDSLPTPEWTATAAIQYNFKLRDQTKAYARLDNQFQGPYYRTGGADTYGYNPNTRDAPASNYVSVRFGVQEGGWDISAFIDNLLNSRTSLYRYQDTVSSPDLRDSTFRPLTGGVTAIYKF